MIEFYLNTFNFKINIKIKLHFIFYKKQIKE